MTMEELLEKSRQELGITPEERLIKARARMVILNRKLAKQFEAQKVTEELLNKVCNL